MAQIWGTSGCFGTLSATSQQPRQQAGHQPSQQPGLPPVELPRQPPGQQPLQQPGPQQGQQPGQRQIPSGNQHPGQQASASALASQQQQQTLQQQLMQQLPAMPQLQHAVQQQQQAGDEQITQLQRQIQQLQEQEAMLRQRGHSLAQHAQQAPQSQQPAVQQPERNGVTVVPPPQTQQQAMMQHHQRQQQVLQASLPQPQQPIGVSVMPPAQPQQQALIQPQQHQGQIALQPLQAQQAPRQSQAPVQQPQIGSSVVPPPQTQQQVDATKPQPLPLAQPQLVGGVPASKKPFKPGDLVEAQCVGWGPEWYPGTIREIHPNGDVQVLWADDEPSISNVPPALVRHRPQPGAPTPGEQQQAAASSPVAATAPIASTSAVVGQGGVADAAAIAGIRPREEPSGPLVGITKPMVAAVSSTASPRTYRYELGPGDDLAAPVASLRRRVEDELREGRSITVSIHIVRPNGQVASTTDRAADGSKASVGSSPAPAPVGGGGGAAQLHIGATAAPSADAAKTPMHGASPSGFRADAVGSGSTSATIAKTGLAVDTRCAQSVVGPGVGAAPQQTSNVSATAPQGGSAPAGSVPVPCQTGGASMLGQAGGVNGIPGGGPSAGSPGMPGQTGAAGMLGQLGGTSSPTGVRPPLCSVGQLGQPGAAGMLGQASAPSSLAGGFGFPLGMGVNGQFPNFPGLGGSGPGTTMGLTVLGMPPPPPTPPVGGYGAAHQPAGGVLPGLPPLTLQGFGASQK